MKHIEQPECALGYTDEQLKRILGDRLPEFMQWMAGQTVSLCDGRAYDHSRKEYVETGCGPHGTVTYPWDLDRFLRGQPVID